MGAQDWSYTPFATSTPYPIKMKILKIGTVDMSLPENECPAKNWSFYAGDCNCSLFSYNAVKYNKGIMVTWVVGGWTMQELKAIEDSANGITYSFQIETWYDTVKPKLKTFYNSDGVLKRDTVKPKVLYGVAGIIQPEPKDTLKKYYFHRYLFFMDRMNETTGKKSASMEDSATRYYKLLYPTKK